MRKTKNILSAAISAAAILAAASGALLSSSCKQDLIPGPEMDKITGSTGGKNAQIEAPLTVKASHGRTKTVTISWSTSNSATQYLVYSAESPHEEFVQIAETKGEANSIDIQEPSGTSAYYKIRAKNYEGAVSAFSDTVFGSTMAAPIISSITSNTDGTAATVSWWMENCDSSTYQDLVNYVVYCYDESGNEVTHATASGAKTSAVLSGLTAKTRYFYQVEAFISADQSNPELSDKVDEETARRLIPDAPEDLEATKGTSAERVQIRWTLPQFCDVAAAGGVYERHPLYFTIERKLEGEDDTAYQKIVSYLGTMKDDSGTSVIKFSCGTEGAAGGGAVSVQPPQPGDADAERSDIYTDYISRSVITYYDSTAKRGSKYIYRVQSFVDDVKKTISAETALAATEGFLLSKPAFSASAVYSYGEGSAITSIKVSFKAVFESYGQDYSYLLYRHYEPMNTKGGSTGTGRDELITSASSTSTLNMTTDVFDLTKDGVSIGYYQYTLYICPPGDGIDTCYDKITMGGSITVIDDSSKLPSITRFEITDGYKDKFHIEWNYDENCQYRLEWKSSLDDFAQTHSLELPKEDLQISGESGSGTAAYEHPAQSGEVRTYTLVSNAGVEISKTYPLPEGEGAEAPEQERLYTLGTAQPQTECIGYRDISVFWPKVQMSTGSFTITAYYAADSGKTDLVTAGNCTVEPQDGGYLCTITGPDGYDNPKRSGLPITMEITAENGATGDTTTAAHTVRTLGPAALNARAAETPSESDISITWNKAEGADGYLIYRLSYTDRTCAGVERSSAYYFKAEEDEGAGTTEVLSDLESDPNAGNCTRVQITSVGGTYTLKDYYAEPTTAESPYQQVQGRLSWGRPYGYIILPVKDKEDFAFEDGTATLSDSSAVNYTADGGRLNEVRASTLGYGLNLVAAKAESGSWQTIQWEEPYEPKYPVVYRRAAGSSGAFSKFYDNDKIQGEKAATMPIYDKQYDAFEYIVKYYSAYPDNSQLELPPSLLAEITSHVQSYSTPQGEKQELDNKGYLLTIDGFNAQLHPERDYCEQIWWTEWDYSARAVGPDSMTIFIQNNNIGEGWLELAAVTQANARAGVQALADDVAAEAEQAAGIRVAPKGIAEGAKGTTDGPLKVLRDYRHTYTFRLNRTIGEDPISVYYADYEKESPTKIAWRDITDEELVKATMLILADIVKDSGMESHTTGTGIAGVGAWERAIDGATGYVDWWQNSGSRFRWRMKDYQHKWSEKPSDNLTNAFITLSDDYNDKNKGEKSSGSLNYLYNSDNSSLLNIGGSNKFDSSRLIPIYVTGNSGLPASYSGTVEFSAKKQYLNVKLSRNGSTTFSKTIEGTDANYWCPINLDGNGYLGQNSDYGWWPSSN